MTPKWSRGATFTGQAFSHSNGSQAFVAITKHLPLKFNIAGVDIDVGDLIVSNFPTDAGYHSRARASGNMAAGLPAGTYIYSGASPKQWATNLAVSADGGGLDQPTGAVAEASAGFISDDWEPTNTASATQTVTIPDPVRFTFNGAPGPSPTLIPLWVGADSLVTKDSTDEHAWIVSQWSDVTPVLSGSAPFAINVPQTNQ